MPGPDLPNHLLDARRASGGMRLLAAALDLVLPSQCITCGTPGTDACAECLAIAPAVVRRSGMTVHVAGAYGETLRRALLRFKEHGQRRLAQPLGAALAEACAASLVAEGVDQAILVGVPSARRARSLRGVDHVELLSRHAAEDLAGRGFRVEQGRLGSSRAVSDQVGLTWSQRHRNVSGSLVMLEPANHAATHDATNAATHAATRGPAAGREREQETGRAVLVVDDIVTTGATLAEGVRAVRAAGFRHVMACAIAAA